MSCQNRPLPAAFVTKATDHAYIGNFMKKKYQALCQLIGKPETTFIYFSAEDIATLISNISGIQEAFALKISFATYTNTSNEEVNSMVANGYRDLMTLVFAPLDVNLQELQHYFIVRPTGGLLPLTKADSTELIARFREYKLPLLEEICRQAGRADFKETKTMAIELSKFNGANGILDEMICQGASGISVFFGSFDREAVHEPTGISVGWQLTLIFEWSKSFRWGTDGLMINYYFDLEDTDGFAGRASLSSAQKVKTESRKPEGANTLNPCPPSTTICP